MRMFRGILAVTAVLLVASGAAAIDQAGTLSGVGPASVDQSTLYEQLADYTGSIGTAQDFEAAYDAYDSEAADDFIVTYVDGWLVEQVGIIAGYWNGPGPADSIDVAFHADASGMPGSAIAGCSFPNNSYVDDGAGNFLMDLTGGPCYLPAGSYWVVIQGNLDFATGGQFGYGYNGVQAGNGGMWRNPGDGFASGCTSWAPVATCIDGGPDYCFGLYGEEAPPGATPTPPPVVSSEPVPAMNRYGIVIMVALLIGVAILVMWRRN